MMIGQPLQKFYNPTTVNSCYTFCVLDSRKTRLVPKLKIQKQCSILLYYSPTSTDSSDSFELKGLPSRIKILWSSSLLATTLAKRAQGMIARST
eukprot:scaffold2962_cov126-Cylindrotheca_fusiformis.AAC.9